MTIKTNRSNNNNVVHHNERAVHHIERTYGVNIIYAITTHLLDSAEIPDIDPSTTYKCQTPRKTELKIYILVFNKVKS